MTDRRLAVIAGSGVAPTDLDGLSGNAFVLARHGASIGLPAHRVDHLANLNAVVEAGATHVLALASTGSLRSDWPVGTVVVPDDFFAPWVTPSIFDDTRGHSVPGFDATWRAEVLSAWNRTTDRPAVDGGVYVQTVGPRFETAAEVRFFATVGDLVGMTVAAESLLAKELGLAYATICVIDNMANGIDDVGLTTDAFQAGVAGNRQRFVDHVRRVVDGLTALADKDV